MRIEHLEIFVNCRADAELYQDCTKYEHVPASGFPGHILNREATGYQLFSRSRRKMLLTPGRPVFVQQHQERIERLPDRRFQGQADRHVRRTNHLEGRLNRNSSRTDDASWLDPPVPQEPATPSTSNSSLKAARFSLRSWPPTSLTWSCQLRKPCRNSRTSPLTRSAS